MANNLKSVFTLLYACVHKLVERLYAFFIRIIYPVDESVIILRSMPDYSDNARALSEYMVKNGYTKKYKIYFDVNNLECYKDRIEGISFISSKSKMGCHNLSCLRLLLTAKYLMSTHELIINKDIARKEQCIIRLWHGCGYKTRQKPNGAIKKIFDAALVPGPLFVKIKAEFWNVDEKYILPIGYPRYDWLKSKDTDALKLIESFKKDEKTKVVMWMPTFRKDKNGQSKYNYIKITQFPILYCIDDWKVLDSYCARYNIVILVKLHPIQEEYSIPFDSFSNIKEIKNDLFEKMNIPMYSFVGMTDALISDYSSIAIDYLIVDKPIAYTLDYYEEDKKTRKFIFDDIREYMPGYHLYNLEDMKSFLYDLSIGVDSFMTQREQLCKIAICPSNNYCEGVLKQFGIVI